ncbi:MAG: hypothetical protein Q4E13_09165 [Clostridia bacterium]|nr:hypothetical protein [Clostridia bacterium]
MNKKLICFMMALVMMCVSTVAFAASPSKITHMASTMENETEVKDEAVSDFVVETVQDKDYATKELNAIVDLVIDDKKAPVQYFDADVQKEISQNLPEDFDLDKLMLIDFAPLTSVNYDTSYGDAWITFDFPFEYSATQTIVAVVGIVTGSDEDGAQVVEWTPVTIEAVEGGNVKVHFPKELLPAIESGEAMLSTFVYDEVKEVVKAEIDQTGTSDETTAVLSKTTGDLVSVVGVETENGGEGVESFDLDVIKLATDASYAQAELDAISQTINAQKAPIAYFGSEVQEAIAALLPEGTDVEKLVMNEFAPLTAINYERMFGSAWMTCEFATKYASDQPVVAVVGVVIAEGDGEQVVEWTPLETKITTDGCVEIRFTEEVLPLVENGNAVIAILSEDIA